MTNTNTSFHGINADTNLGAFNKLLWVIFNLANNYYLPNRASGLNIQDFCPNLDEGDWEKVGITCSPSRSLSDLFWLKLDWQQIKSELGDINVFDTGCGAGGYALMLDKFSNNSIANYYGVDLAPRESWNEIMQKYKFVKLESKNSKNISESVPENTNLFISQSAIEHFEDDLLYFMQIRQFIEKAERNTIQIHLFPSAACLKTFPLHGLREYTPRTVSKITDIFNTENTYSMLFKLGGKRCNKLHYEFINKPLRSGSKKDWRHTKTLEYRQLLKESVEEDIRSGNNTPAFYGLVIHSNYENNIFETMSALTERC